MHTDCRPPNVFLGGNIHECRTMCVASVARQLVYAGVVNGQGQAHLIFFISFVIKFSKT